MFTICRGPAMPQCLQTLSPSILTAALWASVGYQVHLLPSWKGNLALFGRPATWGDDWLLAKSQLWSLCSPWKIFKRRIIWETGQSLSYTPLCADILLIGWWYGNRSYLNGLVVYPTFFFKSEFGNKEFMIWATVSSQSCFCWHLH